MAGPTDVQTFAGERTVTCIKGGKAAVTVTTHAPRIRRWAVSLAVAAGVVGAAATIGLIWSHIAQPPIPWLGPALALTLVGSTTLLLWAWWMRRRGETLRPQLGIGVSAVIAVFLGLASYGPCGDPAGAVIGVLNLFTGQVETDLLGPDAVTACQGPYPLIFKVARVYGLATLVFSALAVLMGVARPAVDWVRIRCALRVDVVAGLDSGTLPLVIALCAERDSQPRRPTWFRRRLRLADWWPLTRPRAAVVVVHPNDTDPLVAEARAHGALVYVGAPTEPEVLRGVIVSWWRHVMVHRLYAVTGSQRDNVMIVTAAQQIIQDRHAPGDTGWLNRAIVPRLVARFSDAREARDWRLKNVTAAGCLMDAFTPDGLLARALVDRLAEYQVTALIVSGDTPLTIAILDQLAQQRAFRHELQNARRPDKDKPDEGGRPPDSTATSEEDDRNEVYQLVLEEVTIVADTASELCNEWRDTRAPCAAVPVMLEPRPSSGDLRAAVADAVARGGRSALIITDPISPLLSARATRLSAENPDLLVLRPSRNVQGVEPLTGADGAEPGATVIRYGPMLVQDGRAPDDTWTVLARQQHEVFCKRRSHPPDDLPPSRREWERGSGGLPDFFREDNLRQHRHLLMLIEEQCYEWKAARASAPAAPTLPRDVVAAVAGREHARWCGFRWAHGWRAPASWGPRARGEKKAVAGVDDTAAKRWLDEHRVNKNLIPWGTYRSTSESGLHTYNIKDTYAIVERLRLWGVEPWPRRYRRTGEVTASELTAPRPWTSARGDQLISRTGDFWVLDHSGQGRGVARDRFPEAYEPTDVPGRYRRRGTVSARRANAVETIHTLEGPAIAEPGMWVLTDEHGDSWPVTDAYLQQNYRAE